MNNDYNPILIYGRRIKDFHNGRGLLCGACGHVYSPREAEDLLRNCNLWLDNIRQIEVHGGPLHCVFCACKYDFVYFSDLAEMCYIVPTSLFKKRYVTKYGELILAKEGDAEFIPSWDLSKREHMTYIDSVAYALYAEGVKHCDLKVLIDFDDFALYDNGTIIEGDLMEDIRKMSPQNFAFHAGLFYGITHAMREMEGDKFFEIGAER